MIDGLKLEGALLEGAHDDFGTLADAPPEEHKDNGSSNDTSQNGNKVGNTQGIGNFADDGGQISKAESEISGGSSSALILLSSNLSWPGYGSGTGNRTQGTTSLK